MKVERRTFKAELRKSTDGRKIRGTAVVFNRFSENLGGYVEQIDSAAFDGCDLSDVRCLFNHDENQTLGRTTSRTLMLTRDSQGMKFACDPPDTSYAHDLMACMERGDIDQCSFSFAVAPGGSEWSQDKASGVTVRTVKKIWRLYDVSVVTFPAYPQTSSEIRTAEEILKERSITSPRNVPDTTILRCKLELAYWEHF